MDQGHAVARLKLIFEWLLCVLRAVLSASETYFKTFGCKSLISCLDPLRSVVA